MKIRTLRIQNINTLVLYSVKQDHQRFLLDDVLLNHRIIRKIELSVISLIKIMAHCQELITDFFFFFV